MKKVFDRRRLCTEADLFQTRKSGKTELGASMDNAQFMCMGDANEQVSIVANDANQAIKIAFKAVKAYALQIDPSAKNKLGGKLLKVGAKEMRFVDGCPRTASLEAFAAGGKPKDGWNSGWVHNDEPGQGKYVNDHNDMESTVQELVGSAGVRRERMRLNTTTAGKVVTGPYKDHIERLETQLLDEMTVPLGCAKQLPYDYNNALLLRLDPWDWTGNVEDLNHRHLFRRVNRAIGITVQPTWYKERIQKALSGTEDERKEVLTKDFNIWQTGRVQEWIKGDEVRPLQKPVRIDDCTSDEGWQVSVGLDFSLGNDLHAMTYLAVRKHDDAPDEFFAGMDAWITEEVLENSTISVLLKKWVADGWLRVSPGKTLEPTLPVQRIMELYESGVFFLGFGYDPNKAKMPINAIKAWIVEETGNVNAAKDLVIPISQTRFSYNPAVEELDFMVRNNPPFISFDSNPMWPYEFDCTALDIDTTMENKKPVKANAGSDACKCDNVQCLCNALLLIDRLEGTETKE